MRKDVLLEWVHFVDSSAAIKIWQYCMDEPSGRWTAAHGNASIIYLSRRGGLTIPTEAVCGLPPTLNEAFAKTMEAVHAYADGLLALLFGAPDDDSMRVRRREQYVSNCSVNQYDEGCGPQKDHMDCRGLNFNIHVMLGSADDAANKVTHRSTEVLEMRPGTERNKHRSISLSVGEAVVVLANKPHRSPGNPTKGARPRVVLHVSIGPDNTDEAVYTQRPSGEWMPFSHSSNN